ncbi:MAG: ATPase, T2SS/T4P/T4SS family [Candidatus Thermoplasmatota archaeon]|nr:ATPase, T2SS/T4P/T4SS family [Candidatus Thermoplasmatota archaeon]
MHHRTILCSHCNKPIPIAGDGSETDIICPVCNNKTIVEPLSSSVKELGFYALEKPYSYISILKEKDSLKKRYVVLQPVLSKDDKDILNFLKETLIKTLDIRLDELDDKAESYLIDAVEQIFKKYDITIDGISWEKILYYLKQQFLGYDDIDTLMKDPYIEDISCDGAQTPIFVYQREFGSLETNVLFNDSDILAKFVVKLAQKCGKHISVSDPMLDATMPDGSRIQMTLSGEITTRGSTFTIRKFRSDPITPIDLIDYNTFSVKMIAYLWMAVEHGFNGLISGGTASGKTSALNALALFIPRESKIVSIEETREVNLPHSNWIPGITRTGFGEVVNDRMVGEIDLFDLMKAALRQRPEYILVGEIRGKEAYVLFQAMATGHTTYSTVHADSTQALIHRLEGKPINIPRTMLQSLDIILLMKSQKTQDQNIRRCIKIVELLNVDNETGEVLTNTVFEWDPQEKLFSYSGKSFILEEIRAQNDMSIDVMTQELQQRTEILEWMNKYHVRSFTQVSNILAKYAETPEKVMNLIKKEPEKVEEEIKVSLLTPESNFESFLDIPSVLKRNETAGLIKKGKNQRNKRFTSLFSSKYLKKKEKEVEPERIQKSEEKEIIKQRKASFVEKHSFQDYKPKHGSSGLRKKRPTPYFFEEGATIGQEQKNIDIPIYTENEEEKEISFFYDKNADNGKISDDDTIEVIESIKSIGKNSNKKVSFINPEKKEDDGVQLEAMKRDSYFSKEKEPIDDTREHESTDEIIEDIETNDDKKLSSIDTEKEEEVVSSKAGKKDSFVSKQKKTMDDSEEQSKLQQTTNHNQKNKKYSSNFLKKKIINLKNFLTMHFYNNKEKRKTELEETEKKVS